MLIATVVHVASQWSIEQWLKNIAQAREALDVDYRSNGEKCYRIPVLPESEVA